MPPILHQFQQWCSKQESFTPKSSIFLHWFRDKYPNIDILNLELMVKDLTHSLTRNIHEVSDLQNQTQPTDMINEALWNEDGIDKDVTASQLEDIVFRESLVFERSSSYTPPREPTARSSSTSYELLSPTQETEDNSLVNTTLIAEIDMQTRKKSVIRCPTNTCDVSEFLTDDPNTEDSSPEVSFHNYPLLHRLADIPDPQSQRQDLDRTQQSSTPCPPPFPESRRNLRARTTHVDYHNLHNYGKQGPDAWGQLDGNGDHKT